MGTLTHGYELFRIKPKENINQMQTRFTYIVSHMRTLGKIFSNEELIVKNLKCLNCSVQPKTTVICEARDLATMDTHTLFYKSQEYEMELERLLMMKKTR